MVVPGMRCQLDLVKAAANTINKHLWGILSAIILKVSSLPAKGINSRVKAIKVRSRGLRNKQRIANATCLHPRDFDLYPKGLRR